MVAMEKGCIAKAAEELFLTRTPLCKKLSDLENLLGEKLFLRNYKELAPTTYALSLYNELLPLYQAHLKIENKFNKTGNSTTINIIFDTTVPEIMYRYIMASIQAEITNRKLKFQRRKITDEVFTTNMQNDEAIFISIRSLTFFCSYKQVMWYGSEPGILLPSHKVDLTKHIDIFLWNDGYVEYFKRRINSSLENVYKSINYIPHNLELTAVLYKIFRGEGAIVLPMKTAVMYRNENLAIKPVMGKFIPVYMYHNDNNTCTHEFEKIKNVISSYI